VNNYIETLLFEASEYETPNAETLAAIQEVQDYRNGKIELDSIKSKKDLSDYFKKLLEEAG